MANYATLISAIQSVITANGNNEITGSILQQTLVSIINSLGSGYQFIGIATPQTTPGTPDQKVFYIGASGTYPNFGPAVIPDGNLAVFYYDSSWHYGSIAFPLGNGAVTTPKLADGSVTTPKLADDSVTLQKLSSQVLDKLLALGLIDASNGDFCIADGNGNVIVKFSGGHIKTKNFDSEQINIDIGMSIVDYDSDFGIADESGYVVVKFLQGNIFVKNFTSAPGYGKRFSFIGDSITTFANYPGSNNPYYTGSNAGITNVNMTWWKRLCDKQGGIINRIYANGGMDVVNGLCLHYNELFGNGQSGTSPDYIFILGGINDWYHGKTLGTIDDEEATNTTFYAAYKYLLKMLHQTYPFATVVGLTILNSMIMGTTVPYLNSLGASIQDFCDAIRECCNYYSVQCIDLNKLLSINGNNYTTYLNDMTHPNNVGAASMADKINSNLIFV